MNTFFPLRAGYLLIAAVAASSLVACGGGGGGGGGKASSSSRSINSQNQTQIVAAVMGHVGAPDSLDDLSGEDETSAPLMTRADKAVARARAARAVARAAEEVPWYCSTGRLLFDEDTGEQRYEECVVELNDDASFYINGSITDQDFSDDPGAEYDFVNSYDIRFETRFGNGDLIADTLDGSAVGNYTDTGEHGETRMQFATSYRCDGRTGNFTGDYDIESDISLEGDEATFSENGQMRFTSGTWIFQGNLTITTTDPIRYREGYNNGYPYDGSYTIEATDGSSVTLSFVAGGVYVDDQHYTWAEFQQQVVLDEIYAGCGQ